VQSGGGVSIFYDASVSFTSCSIYGNNAFVGGGIALYYDCTVLLVESYIYENTADYGDDIAAELGEVCLVETEVTDADVLVGVGASVGECD